MGKFRVGDFVEANELSDGHYSVTCRNNGWCGYVVSVDSGDDGLITVCKRRDRRGSSYEVHEQYFDLVTSEDEGELSAPEKDLFGFLYSR